MSLDRSNIIKIVVISIVVALITAIVIYCLVQIFHKDDAAKLPFAYEQQLNESDKIWGAVPNSACKALERAYLVTMPYSSGGKDGTYSCSTPEIGIEGPEDKKTLQYTASGFGDKATNLKLVMKINGNQDSADAIAARKVWTIYSALLAESVFSQVMSEDEMQKLAHLDNGKTFSNVYNTQFLAKASVKKDGLVSVYTYQIQGLPVVSID